MPGRVAIVAAAACAVLAACTGTAPPEPPTSPGVPSASTSPGVPSASGPPATGNGSLYTSRTDASTKPIIRHPIERDGTLGPGTRVFTGPATEDAYAVVLDGVGPALAIGSLTQYWTGSISVIDADRATQTRTLDAPEWCGGEGLGYNPCVLLDATRIVRSSRLGDPGLPEETIYVSSLETGQTLAQFGPFATLLDIQGTADPNTVLITTTDVASQSPPEPRPGAVALLDVTSGALTAIGTHEAGWGTLCPLGTDSVLGWVAEGGPTVSVVGPAQVATVTLTDQDTPLGCSADGRWLYVRSIPSPASEESAAHEQGPQASVDRIDLATGARETALDLPDEQWTEAITR